MSEIKAYVESICNKALNVVSELAMMSSEQKNKALESVAGALDSARDEIKKANAIDLEHGKARGLTSALLDRLSLDDKRIDAMIEGVRQVVCLDDPIGVVLEERNTSSGLHIKKVRVPIGVIAVIYESRPNVTVDSAVLCLKAGSAVILRGGSEAINSNKALASAIAKGLSLAGLDSDCVQLIDRLEHEVVSHLVRMDTKLDLVIPRGGERLIRAVAENATVPVIKHYKGVCHVYVDKSADIEIAKNIVINAKCQRPGVCNAIETLLVHEDVAAEFLPNICTALSERGVKLRLCKESAQHVGVLPHELAVEDDWYAEYLDLIISIKIVRDVREAVAHINKYGSKHSDAVVAIDKDVQDYFTKAVDTSSAYVNTSTRFTDGFEFGLGAEIGISTDKIHARGPMGLSALCTYKYVISSDGKVRE